MESNLVAYAAFELNGKQYRKGDLFTVPEGWTFSPQEPWEGELFAEGSNDAPTGMRFQFATPGEPDENGKKTDPIIRKVILPISAE